MALSKQNNELPEEFEVTEPEQVSFEDLEFEAEFVGEEELGPKEYYTISGKVQKYKPTWERYGIGDLDVGDEFEGEPEVTIFEKKDKSYNAGKLRLMDDGEILDLYFNFPKKDFPHVQNINKYFDFYRGCFDFIFSILRYRDETNVVDKNGEEVDNFKKVNIETFMKYVDGMERVGIRITEGKDGYNNWIIVKME